SALTTARMRALRRRRHLGGDCVHLHQLTAAHLHPRTPCGASTTLSISTAWRQELSAWLAAHKSYPEAARRRGEEGSVTLRFAVERSGRVTEVSVVRGSGSSILDAAAEAMLRNATLPVFPATMSQQRIVVTVQVHFALTN
ncbi:MAG TPA: energy transducer TonB, partial [Acetobacteraceae bacterium]|nr:energy transducer TonB [Acetobacteraceae bacterium]